MTQLHPCAQWHSHQSQVCLSRTQLAYGRFFEGRTQLQTFASQLTDAIVLCNTYSECSLPDKGSSNAEQAEQHDEKKKAHDKFRDTVVHLASLLHAIGLATLREDFDCSNLCVRRLRVLTLVLCTELYQSLPTATSCSASIAWCLCRSFVLRTDSALMRETAPWQSAGLRPTLSAPMAPARRSPCLVEFACRRLQTSAAASFALFHGSCTFMVGFLPWMDGKLVLCAAVRQSIFQALARAACSNPVRAVAGGGMLLCAHARLQMLYCSHRSQPVCRCTIPWTRRRRSASSAPATAPQPAPPPSSMPTLPPPRLACSPRHTAMAPLANTMLRSRCGALTAEPVRRSGRGLGSRRTPSTRMWRQRRTGRTSRTRSTASRTCCFCVRLAAAVARPLVGCSRDVYPGRDVHAWPPLLLCLSVSPAAASLCVTGGVCMLGLPAAVT